MKNFTFHHIFPCQVHVWVEVDLSDPEIVLVKPNDAQLYCAMRDFHPEEVTAWVSNLLDVLEEHLTPEQQWYIMYKAFK